MLRVIGTWAASRFIPRAVSGGRTAWGETGEFFEPRQRPQPIVYGLSRNVLGLWLRWLENTPPVLLGKNEGCGIGRAEQIGQQVVPGNRYLGRVVFNTACCIWPVGGLGRGLRSGAYALGWWNRDNDIWIPGVFSLSAGPGSMC